MKRKLAVLLLSTSTSLNVMANNDMTNNDFWSADDLYPKGAIVSHDNMRYQSNWESQGVEPQKQISSSNPWEHVYNVENTLPVEAFQITEPVDDQVVFIGEPLSVSILPMAKNIRSITLQLNGKKVGEITDQPFSYSFTPEVEASNSVLAVIAKYDDEEQIVTRNLTFIPQENSGIPPQQTQFELPFNGQFFFFGDPILVKINVPQGSQSPVDVFDDNGQHLQTLISSPFEFFWMPEYQGPRQLKLSQQIKNQEISATVSVNIDASNKPDNKPEIPEIPEIPEVPEMPEIPEIPEVPDMPEMLLVTSSVSDGDYAPVGEEINLSASVVKGEAEEITFSINGRMLHKFNAPPYSLRWTPTVLGRYEFEIESRSKNETPTLPVYSTIAALTPESIKYCHSQPYWKPDTSYGLGDVVQHLGSFYVSQYNDYSEPQKYPSINLGNAWTKTTCPDMVNGTNPDVRIHYPQKLFNTGDSVSVEVEVREYQNRGVSTKEVVISDLNGKELQRLTKPPFVYNHKIRDADNSLLIKITNTLGVFSDSRVDFMHNTPPSGQINFQQGFSQKIKAQKPFDILVNAFDREGWVGEGVIYIDGVEIDRKYLSRPQGFEQYLSASATLPAGSYDINVILTDNDQGETVLTKTLVIKAI